MDTFLLLIAINFLVVPFLQEAEAQGRELRRFPGLFRVLPLSHVRSLHWFRPFCVFASLFLAFAMVRAQSGDVDGLILAIYFVIMQVVLWTVVFLTLCKHARTRSNAGTPFDEIRGCPIALLLLRRP